MTFTFKKAERHAVRLKIGIDGPSGSGKTMGALALALGIANGNGRVAVADSENGSASLYADRFDFDAISLAAPDVSVYKQVIDAAVDAGYSVLVIDSLSHAWLKLLNDKETYDRQNPKTNQWANWSKFGAQWESLMRHILDAPIHVVATMRSKQSYEQVEDGGKKKIVKLGMQPQVRDGAEYEFGIVFSVNIQHAAEATKDRTGLFTDRMLDLCSPKLHAELRDWMNAGGPTPVAAPVDRVVKGRRLADYATNELEDMLAALDGTDPKKHPGLIAAIETVIADRGVALMQEAEDKHQAGLTKATAGAV